MLKLWLSQCRHSSSLPAYSEPKAVQEIKRQLFANMRKADDDIKNLISKKYIRGNFTYNPPVHTRATIEKLCKRFSYDKTASTFVNETAKYRFFYYCDKKFNHKVPAKIFSSINSVEDTIKFYETPVSGIMPEKIHSKSLPPHLNVDASIIKEHPENGIEFEGSYTFPDNVSSRRQKVERKRYPNFDKHVPSDGNSEFYMYTKKIITH